MFLLLFGLCRVLFGLALANQNKNCDWSCQRPGFPPRRRETGNLPRLQGFKRVVGLCNVLFPLISVHQLVWCFTTWYPLLVIYILIVSLIWHFNLGLQCQALRLWASSGRSSRRQYTCHGTSHGHPRLRSPRIHFYRWWFICSFVAFHQAHTQFVFFSNGADT